VSSWPIENIEQAKVGQSHKHGKFPPATALMQLGGSAEVAARITLSGVDIVVATGHFRVSYIASTASYAIASHAIPGLYRKIMWCSKLEEVVNTYVIEMTI
jgi:hypothetical protein